MEERRAMFDKEISQVWIDKIKRLRPEYIADQFMGKAPDVVKLGFDELEWPKHLISQDGGVSGQPSSQNNETPSNP